MLWKIIRSEEFIMDKRIISGLSNNLYDLRDYFSNIKKITVNNQIISLKNPLRLAKVLFDQLKNNNRLNVEITTNKEIFSFDLVNKNSISE